MNEAPSRAPSRILSGAALYFVLVFAAGLIFGPARVLWLEPWLGPTIAVLCETPLLVLVMVFAARWAPGWAGLQGGWRSRLALGVAALALQQIADLSAGFGLRGMNLAQQLGYFATPAGAIYAVALALFALMPLVVYLRRPHAPSARTGADAVAHNSAPASANDDAPTQHAGQ